MGQVYDLYGGRDVDKQNDLQLDYQNRGPQTYLCSVHAYSSNQAEDHFVCWQLCMAVKARVKARQCIWYSTRDLEAESLLEKKTMEINSILKDIPARWVVCSFLSLFGNTIANLPWSRIIVNCSRISDTFAYSRALNPKTGYNPALSLSKKFSSTDRTLNLL